MFHTNCHTVRVRKQAAEILRVVHHWLQCLRRCKAKWNTWVELPLLFLAIGQYQRAIEAAMEISLVVGEIWVHLLRLLALVIK